MHQTSSFLLSGCQHCNTKGGVDCDSAAPGVMQENQLVGNKDIRPGKPCSKQVADS